MNNLFILAIIPVLMLTIPNVYAGGPRFDAPEDGTQREIDCYREGWEQGFAHQYHEDRAEECEEYGKDWYNITWEDACIDSGQTKQDCDVFKEENNDNINEDLGDLGNESTGKCWVDGFEDGQNNPFNQERNNRCNDYRDMYYKGFIEGCMSVSGNTKEICETFTDQ